MDAKILHEFLEYRDGELYWKKSRNKIKAWQKAGTKTKCGYISVCLNKEKFLAHRIVFFMHYGYAPIEIDHIDGNKQNNNIENLRAANRSQNNSNVKCRKDSKSKIKGIRWHKLAKKWEARLQHNKTPYYAGLFDDIKDAIEAITILRKKFHGEFSNHG